MAKYHTEGIVKDVELTQESGSFTLEATPPYAIEENDGGKTDTSILFVEEGEASQPQVLTQKGNAEGKVLEMPIRKSAFLASQNATFEFRWNAKPIDTTALLLLKQNRSKLRIVVDGDNSEKKTASESKQFSVSSITMK